MMEEYSTVRTGITDPKRPTNMGQDRASNLWSGKILPDAAAAREPFSEWNEPIALIGNTVASSRAYAPAEL